MEFTTEYLDKADAIIAMFLARSADSTASRTRSITQPFRTHA